MTNAQQLENSAEDGGRPTTTAASGRRGGYGRLLWRSFLQLTKRVLLAYLIVILMLRFFENKLVYPAPTAANRWREPNWLGHEDVEFSAADGVPLHGWFVSPSEPRGYLLYCHGNGENVADQAELLARFSHRHRLAVLAFDYRGYGKSGGSPNEQGVLADGKAAYDWLRQRALEDRQDGRGRPNDRNLADSGDDVADEAAPPPPLIMGRSLGGGVAVDLAVHNPTSGLILQNTFSSMPDAAARIYWWIPVHWLMKNRFDSHQKIPNYRGPLLQSHSPDDNLIPIELAEKLFAAAGSKDKEFVKLAGSHNALPSDDYYRQLDAFLTRLLEN